VYPSNRLKRSGGVRDGGGLPGTVGEMLVDPCFCEGGVGEKAAARKKVPSISQLKRKRDQRFLANPLILLVPEEGVARLSLRPSMASAFAAGLGAVALPCVVLFLLLVGAPRPFSFDA
jgi:hypothetical protein